MLLELIKDGFGEKDDLNCAEKVLRAANHAYQLGLENKSLKVAAGFGGGMAVEGTCGALTASIMVLGILFVKERAHESGKMKELTQELLTRYETEMKATDCASLKAKYRTEELKCRVIIEKAAEILDDIVRRETGEKAINM